MGIKQYYFLRGRKKNKIWSRMKRQGGGGAAVDLFRWESLSLYSN